MTHADDCARFMVSLDRLEAEDFGGDELEWLEAHAARCPDCAALLRMREHFPSGSDEELAAAVPHGMVEGMWNRVSGTIESRAATERAAGAAPERRARRRVVAMNPRFPWVQPAMAAALVLLLVGLSFLLGELRGLRRTEMELRERLAAQEGRIEGMALAMAPSGRQGHGTALPTGGLLGGESYTVGELRVWLSRLPAGAAVLGASDLRRLEARMPERRAARFRRAIATPALADGLQAEELLELIDALGLDANERIDERRLDDIARGLARGRGL